MVADIGRMLMILGLVLLVGGAVLWLGSAFGTRIPFLGRLPGDIHVQRGNWSFYFPLTTSIVVSVLLTLVLTFLSRR
jgi:hypothetical protein